MNKKLMAVAVAGLFAAPAVALAQSSVTISGQIKGGYESLKLSGSTAAPTNRNNSSQHGVVDDSSALVFSVVEDLGGGMQAVVRLDMRIKPDDAGSINSPTGLLGGGFNTSNIVSGNSHFGLRSNAWGRVVFGRQDLHYFNTESNITDKGSLRSSNTSLLSYIGGASIANATRTQNVVHYLSPNWSGFTFIAAYSSNPFAQEADINSGIRKGSAWNFNPNFAAANWQVGYSYWSAKPDGASGSAAVFNNAVNAAYGTAIVTATNTAATNQRGDRLYGSYRFPFGLKIGFAYDKTKFKSSGGADVARRDAWSLPVSYAWGNHTVHVNYTKANDEKVAAGDQGAAMWALAYSYDLSKRTSAALTYAKISNKSGGTYNLFTSSSLGLGNTAGGINAGEDPKMYGLTLRHAF
jgi:predicted porin